MNYAARTFVLLFGLLITLACARANGPGGGHGGSGGHGSGGHASGGHGSAGHGGRGGHSAGHLSSGSSPSHSFAHPFTHMFHHGRRHHNFEQRIAFFPRRRHFGSFSCTNDAFWPRFRNGFNCFNNGFLLDPFLFGAFSMLGPAPDATFAYPAVDSGAGNEMLNPEDTEPRSETNSLGEQPVTLLQLLDGSMYGLTSYRVVGHELHYTTTYGGQNSVPLDHIDFTQTLKLNAERNVPFVLEPKSTPR
jgi:hypothetical protein